MTSQRIKRTRGGGRKQTGLNPLPGSSRVIYDPRNAIPAHLRIVNPAKWVQTTRVLVKRRQRKKVMLRNRYEANNPLRGGVDALNACFPKTKPTPREA